MDVQDRPTHVCIEQYALTNDGPKGHFMKNEPFGPDNKGHCGKSWSMFVGCSFMLCRSDGETISSRKTSQFFLRDNDDKRG